MHITYVHQAIAEFFARNFEQTAKLLCRAFQNIEIRDLYLSDASFNAIYDAIEIVELFYENLPILEKNNYAETTTQSLKIAIEKGNIDLATFQKNILDFENLLAGLQVGLHFFSNYNLSFENPETPLSFALEEDGFIELYQLKKDAATTALIQKFNDCFTQKKEKNIADFEAEIETLLQENPLNYSAIQLQIEAMMQQFPTTQKKGFLQLGNLYFEKKEYRLALDAYMKSIVMGTPKNTLRANIQTACNSLKMYASTKEEEKHWKEFLEEF